MDTIACITLVACGKHKADHLARARDLYQGDLFQKRLKYVEAQGDRFAAIYIVSARHALVKLDEELHPYDQTVSAMTRAERLRWGRRVVGSLAALHPGRLEVSLWAGADYRKPIVFAALEAGHGWSWPTPEPCGLPIGEQKRWFVNEKRRREAEALNVG